MSNTDNSCQLTADVKFLFPTLRKKSTILNLQFKVIAVVTGLRKCLPIKVFITNMRKAAFICNKMDTQYFCIPCQPSEKIFMNFKAGLLKGRS